jgi:hypothetical protein
MRTKEEAMKTTAGLLSAMLIGAALISPAQANMRSSMLEGLEVVGMGGHHLGLRTCRQ